METLLFIALAFVVVSIFFFEFGCMEEKPKAIKTGAVMFFAGAVLLLIVVVYGGIRYGRI